MWNMLVEQHRLESKTFKVKMNQVLNKNERLLEQVLSKDIVNILVNSSVNIASVNVHEREKCLKLKTKLLNKKDFVEKEIYDKLFKSFTTLEKHCISLEVDIQHNQENFQMDNSVSNQSAPSFDQFSLQKKFGNTSSRDDFKGNLRKSSACKSKVPKSVSANKKEPSQSWGSIVSDVPSSSLDECRLGMLRYQGFTTWKDLDITYSRWQFCDSNLEVAFRQHTCFIRNLEDVDLLTGSRTGNYLLHCLLED
ncbi:hypothetical protein Tco_0494560 [Tanacetum coccineum]